MTTKLRQKEPLYFTFDFGSCLVLFSVSFSLRTKIHPSRSPKYAEFGHIKLLFCRERQINVQRIITHEQSHCSAYIHCLVTFLSPLSSMLLRLSSIKHTS